MGFDWRKTLGAIAPLAGTMIGGPFGAIAGAAVGKIFGHEEGKVPSEKEMAQYIEKATPDQIVELKKLDDQLEIRMEELGIQREQLSYDDTDSARKMQTANNSNFPAILCIMLTIGFFGSLALMMSVVIPKANEPTVYMMIGSLGTCWIGSCQFWNGTTKGSADKNNMLSEKK